MSAEARVRFWNSMVPLLPLAALIVTPTVAALLGGFTEPLVDVEVSPATAFGILGTMLFPLAAFFFATVKRNEASAVFAATWPAVPGVLQSCKVDERAARGGRIYALTVGYRYSVAGQEYQGDRLLFGPKWLDDADLANKLTFKYKPNASITVHVDPNDPTNAVLETAPTLAWQRTFRMWFLFALPLVFTAFMAIRAVRSH